MTGINDLIDRRVREAVDADRKLIAAWLRLYDRQIKSGKRAVRGDELIGAAIFIERGMHEKVRNQ